MSDNVRVRVGTPEDMGRRFVDAWRRAERGEAVNDANITFPDLEALTKLGLLSRTPDSVVAPYAEVDARFVL